MKDLFRWLKARLTPDDRSNDQNNLIERYKDNSIDREIYSDFELTIGDGLDESA